MSEKKKTLITIGGITLIVVILVGTWLYISGVRFRSPVTFLPDAQTVVNSMHEKAARDADSNITLDTLQEISGGNATTAVNHDNALYLYRGQVVQFNDNCRANPVIMTLSAKNVVMLDNRSQYQRTITVGPRTYSVAPYDYVLASFNDVGQYDVSCDSAQKVGIVSIQ